MQDSVKRMQRVNMIIVQIDEVYHEAAVRFGLSDSAMWILYALAQARSDLETRTLSGSLTQAQICRLCGMSKQTVHSSVNRLIRDGILKPLSSSRNAPLQPTPKGEALIRDKISRLIDAENAVMESWTVEEQNLFVRLQEEYQKRLAAQVETFCSRST